MEPIEYLRILRRRWWIIAGSVLVAVAVVVATTPSDGGSTAAPTARTYKAVNSLLQEPGGAQFGQPLGPPTKIESLAFFVTAGEVPERAAEEVGWTDDPAILATKVTTEADPSVGALKIEVTDDDGERAARIANAFADAFIGFLAERGQEAYQRQLDTTSKRMNDLDTRVRALDVALAGLPREGNSQADLTRSERNALVQEYGSVFSSYQRLQAQGPPGPGFYSVQLATPIPVDQGGFQAPASRSGRLSILGLLAVLVGIGAAIAVDRLDPRVRSRQDAESAFGLPVLAEIPAVPRRDRRAFVISVLSAPGSRAAEQYRILRTHLLFLRSPAGPGPAPVHGYGPYRDGTNGNGASGHRADGYAPSSTPARWSGRAPSGAQVVLVASPGEGEGKTSTVANLAACFAEWGLTVLVLGCDFQDAGIARFLGVASSPGLGDIDDDLGAGAGLEQVARPSRIRNVWVAPCGVPRDDAADILARMPGVIAEARRMADVVLIDTGPILAVSDATELLPMVDAVIVVGRAGKTTSDSAGRAAELLSRFQAPVLGVALVGGPDTGPQPSQGMIDVPASTDWAGATPVPPPADPSPADPVVDLVDPVTAALAGPTDGPTGTADEEPSEGNVEADAATGGRQPGRGEPLIVPDVEDDGSRSSNGGAGWVHRTS